MDRNRIVGTWDAGFREFSIVTDSGSLMLTCPEAPPGYDGRLVDAGPDRYLIRGGPLEGAELVLDDDGVSLGGHIPLSRLEREARAPAGSGLTLPQPDLNAEKEDAFEHLWNWMAHPSRPPEVDLGGFSTCDFVQWLTSRQRALFHGSNRIDLEELAPATWPTTTAEPASGDAIVYANSDGLCSLFLAVVDNELGQDICQRVDRYYDAEGDHVDLYQFSAPGPGHPFGAGALYLLAREQFEPVPLYPGGPLSGEWVSPHAVRPMARLIVTPDDFPLLEAVAVTG